MKCKLTLTKTSHCIIINNKKIRISYYGFITLRDYLGKEFNLNQAIQILLKVIKSKNSISTKYLVRDFIVLNIIRNFINKQYDFKILKLNRVQLIKDVLQFFDILIRNKVKVFKNQDYFIIFYKDILIILPRFSLKFKVKNEFRDVILDIYNYVNEYVKNEINQDIVELLKLLKLLILIVI